MQLSDKEYIGLGRVPKSIGALLRGWDIEEKDFRNHALNVVDFRVMTSACPHDCFHCFTDKQKKTLTLEEIKRAIDEIADLGARAIDYLGEGEPTIDENFFDVVEYTASRYVQPVVFTDAATKLRDIDFVRRLYDAGASVSPKCDSLFNAEYQNWVVGDKTRRYFDERNEAIDVLLNEGFNKSDDETTRLGFDMVVSKRNIGEVEQTLRFCRENNLWIVFSFYIPAGRSKVGNIDESMLPSKEEKMIMRETVARVDAEYGFIHPIYNNFATVPCIELMQVYGNGNVSTCPGNEVIVGNIRTHSMKELIEIILNTYPTHNPLTFDGHCPYRPKIAKLINQAP